MEICQVHAPKPFRLESVPASELKKHDKKEAVTRYYDAVDGFLQFIQRLENLWEEARHAKWEDYKHFQFPDCQERKGE